MDYYVIPEFVYIFFLFCAAAVILAAIYVVVDQIRLHICKKQKEKEFFAEREEYDPEELADYEETFPGPYTAEYLRGVAGSCYGMLDWLLVRTAPDADEYRRLFLKAATEQQEARALEELQNWRGLMGFISFMQQHGIDAYLTHLQNGEIFFEDKHERVEDGDVE